MARTDFFQEGLYRGGEANIVLWHLNSLMTNRGAALSLKQRPRPPDKCNNGRMASIQKRTLPPTQNVMASTDFFHGGLYRGGEANIVLRHSNSPTTNRGAAIRPKQRPRPQSKCNIGRVASINKGKTNKQTKSHFTSHTKTDGQYGYPSQRIV
jgi:hypothetical protein